MWKNRRNHNRERIGNVSHRITSWQLRQFGNIPQVSCIGTSLGVGYSVLAESSSNFIGCYWRSFRVLMFIRAAPPTHPGRLPRLCVLFLSLHGAFSPSAWTLPTGLLRSHPLKPSHFSRSSSISRAFRKASPALFQMQYRSAEFPSALGVSTGAAITSNVDFACRYPPPPTLDCNHPGGEVF